MARHKLNPDGTRADVSGLVVATGTLIETYEVRMGADDKPFLVKVEPVKNLPQFYSAVWRTNKYSTASFTSHAFTSQDLLRMLFETLKDHPSMIIDVYITYHENGETTFSRTLP